MGHIGDCLPGRKTVSERADVDESGLPAVEIVRTKNR